MSSAALPPLWMRRMLDFQELNVFASVCASNVARWLSLTAGF